MISDESAITYKCRQCPVQNSVEKYLILIRLSGFMWKTNSRPKLKFLK